MSCAHIIVIRLQKKELLIYTTGLNDAIVAIFMFTLQLGGVQGFERVLQLGSLKAPCQWTLGWKYQQSITCISGSEPPYDGTTTLHSDHLVLVALVLPMTSLECWWYGRALIGCQCGAKLLVTLKLQSMEQTHRRQASAWHLAAKTKIELPRTPTSALRGTQAHHKYPAWKWHPPI